MNQDFTEPLATLHRILSLRVGTAWSYTGPMIFESDGIRLEGNTESSLQIDDGRANGTIIVPGFVAEPDRGVNGMITLTDAGHEVTIPAFVYGNGYRSREGAESLSSFSVVANAIIAMPQDERAAYVRETILGMHLGPPASTGMATHFNTTFFGRTAFVAGYPTEDPALFVDSIQIVYDGVPLENDERFAIYDVLRLFTGVRGQSWFYEAFDADLNLLGFYYQNHGRIERNNPVQPVNLHPVTGQQEIVILAREFPQIVERMRDLRKQSPLAVAAMMHHYNDGSMQASPTSKMRDMSVALEALGLVLLGRPAERTPIIAPDDFIERFEPVMEAFKQSFGDLETNNKQKYGWLSRKMDAINIASPREELFDALDALKIGLSAKERAWIRKMRNVVLHSGFHGDESQEAGLSINSEASALFANVFARALLRRLGFSGRYLDAVSYEDQYPLDTAPPYTLLPDSP